MDLEEGGRDGKTKSCFKLPNDRAGRWMSTGLGCIYCPVVSTGLGVVEATRMRKKGGDPVELLPESVATGFEGYYRILG